MPPAELYGDEITAAPRSAGHARKFMRAAGLPETIGDAAGESDVRSSTSPSPHWRVSIYVLVLTMVAALAAPAAGILSYVVDQENQERQQQISIRGSQLAGEIADRHSQEFTTLRSILAVFASTGWLEDGELGVLHRRAKSALAGTNRYLVVLDERNQQLLNTRVDLGAALRQPFEIGSAAEALIPGSSVVSEILYEPTAAESVLSVLGPVEFPDGGRRVLVLSRSTETLPELFGSVLGEMNWSVAVLDSAGQVATKVVSLGESNPSVPAECRDGVIGFRTWGPPERLQYGFVRSVNGSPWYVCTWVAAEHVTAKVDDLWTTLVTSAGAWLGIALMAAALLSGVVSRSIARTATVGEALNEGREISMPRSFITEIDDVRRFLTAAAAERIRKDQRLQLILRETAHRAKNQLALAASLVDISSRNASSPADLKTDLTGRLLALSRSIDAMTSDRHDVALLEQLIRAQLAPFVDGAGDRLQVRGPEVAVSGTAAQSLSLVLHELATNASKYGAWSEPGGKVVIEWEVRADDLALSWVEFGTTNVEPERHGFGTVLLDTLINKALRGAIHREVGSTGFSCRIAIPLPAINPEK